MKTQWMEKKIYILNKICKIALYESFFIVDIIIMFVLATSVNIDMDLTTLSERNRMSGLPGSATFGLVLRYGRLHCVATKPVRLANNTLWMYYEASKNRLPATY